MREGSWGETVGMLMAVLRCVSAAGGSAARADALCLGQAFALNVLMSIHPASTTINKIIAAAAFLPTFIFDDLRCIGNFTGLMLSVRVQNVIVSVVQSRPAIAKERLVLIVALILFELLFGLQDQFGVCEQVDGC